MADYRCPTDDLIFETVTDHRKPGALATGKLSAHPPNGHPDCPKCEERMQAEAGMTVGKPQPQATRSGGRTIR